MKERFDRLAEVWNNLPSGRKFSLGAAVIGILVLSGAILAFSGSSKSMRVLVSGADAKDLGEVVDVTGWLGGYNFQWAWASGHAAGEVI